MARIRGTGRNDTLTGTTAADTIFGFAGIDIISGRGGNDVIRGGTSSDRINGNGGNDRLFGDRGNDRVLGADGSDSLYGGSGRDTLRGGNGNDVLEGGTGADTFDGGNGIDTVSYRGSASVLVNLALGYAVGGDGTGDLITRIENVSGSSFGDWLGGNALDNVLSGNGGNDMLFGQDGNDTLLGGAGNDILDGGAGADRLMGGTGTDTVSYASATAGVYVVLQSGIALGGASGDTYDSIENLTGSAFDDFLVGNSADNILTGGEGNDLLAGADGADTLYGGAGIDTADYSMSLSGVTVYLDTNVSGGDAAGDTYYEVESVTGSRFGDFLAGLINGVVDGREGNDSLYSSVGHQTLRGGEGRDSIYLSGTDNGSDYVVLERGMGADNIYYFDPLTRAGGEDKLALLRFDFLSLGAAIAGDDVVNNGTGTATAAHAQLIFNWNTNQLFYDEDGTGSAYAPEHIATLIGHAAAFGGLNPGDFIFYA